MTFSRRISSSNHCIQWSQEPRLLLEKLDGPSCSAISISRLHFIRAKQHGKAIALSRRSYLAPRPGDPTFDNQKQVTLGPTWLRATSVFDTPLDSSIIDTMREDLKTYVFAQAILDQINPSRASCSRSPQSSTDYRQFKWHDGLLFFKDIVYVPDGSSRL